MHGTICDGGASKISCSVREFDELGTVEGYCPVRNPACLSGWLSLKMAPQGCRQGNEVRLQFRVICEVTTGWPVQDINGNKDTRA